MPRLTTRSTAAAAAAVLASAVLLSACTGGASATSDAVASAALRVQTGASPSGSADAGIASTPAAEEPVVQVVRMVEPAVVSITATSVVPNPFFGSTTQRGVGSGFIVSPDGVIITNDHVVEGASSITVTLPDGRAFDARVLRTDAGHDLAALKVDATGLPTVSLGSSSSLLLGQSVVAIGYALDLSGGPTVTDGIISSLERDVQAQDPNAPGGIRTYHNALQTSAAINPGNSGGPLVDLAGRVVGINTAGVSSADNIGFAIAIDAARPFILSAMKAA